MNFTENWKRFWNLNRRHEAGFTLVELIVVIAILAILAGVAVPAYSGYIDQANKQADLQLLDAINTAFASACAINGESHIGRATTTKLVLAEVEGGKQVTGLDTENDKIDASFSTYFEGGVFKVFTKLSYIPGLGVFAVDDGITLTYTSGGVEYTLTISAEDKDAFYNSKFSELGTAYLLGEVDNVVKYAQDHPGLLTNVKQDPEFVKLCKLFGTYPSGDPDKDYQIEMQALVLYTGSQYDQLDTNDVYDAIIQNGGAYMTPYLNETTGKPDDSKNFAANAAMYALGLAFANTDEGKAIMAEKGWSASDPDDIQALMTYKPDMTDKYGNPTGKYEPNQFITWLESNEADAKANLEGFGGAMGMLTDNQGNLDYEAILNAGYGSDTEGGLADVLGGLLDKQE